MKKKILFIIISTIVIGVYNYITEDEIVEKGDMSLSSYVDSRESIHKDSIGSSESVVNILNPMYSYRSYVELFDLIVLYRDQIKAAIVEEEIKEEVSFWTKIRITSEIITSKQKTTESLSANQILSLCIPIILILFLIKSLLSFNLFQRAPMLDEYYKQFEEDDK